MKDNHQGNDMSIFDGAAGTPAGQGLSAAALGQGVISATQGQFVFGNPLQAAAQERMRINASGNLLIGQGNFDETTDLKHPAWQATISTLENAWLAKFGSEWVNGDKLDEGEDKFFAIAAFRLTSAHKLEKHVMINRMHPVYRIVE